MYRCPNCGGDMTFSPEKQKLVCAYCDSEFTVDEFEAKKGVNAEEHTFTEEQPEFSEEDEKYFQATIFTCPQCGGEILSTTDTAATFCSFCGASVLLKSRVSNEMRPDMIIPFKISKQQCEEEYRKKLSRALFVPSEMKKDDEIEKFRSIYMPYWVYSYDYNGPIRTKGKTSSRRGDYIYTKHYDLTADAQLDYDGISFDASSSFSDSLSEAVAPFDMKQADSFKAAYMTGHYADTKDVNADVYEPDAADVVREHAIEEIYRNGDYSKYGIARSDISVSFEPSLKSIRYGFFPVWFLANRSKKGDRVSYAVVNGQTGKIAADLPVDLGKYLLGSLLLAVPIYLLLSFVFNLTFTPRVMLGLAIVLGIISIVIGNREYNKVYTRENYLDDKGYQTMNRIHAQKNKKIRTRKGTVNFNVGDFLSGFGWIWIVIIGISVLSHLGPAGVAVIIVAIFAIVIFSLTKGLRGGRESESRIFAAPMKEKAGMLIKPAIGIIAALVVVLWNPYQDPIHYGAAIASLGLTVWTFTDIIKAHNRLTERKLPQLGKRGGDENA